MHTTVSSRLHADHHQESHEIRAHADEPATQGLAPRQPLRVRHARDVWRLPAFMSATTTSGAIKMRALGMFLDSEPGRRLSSRSRDVLRTLVKVAGSIDSRRFDDGRVVAVSYIGVACLTEHLGPHWSTSTTKRALAELVAAGVVTRSRSYRMNSVTVVELPAPVSTKPRKASQVLVTTGLTSRLMDEPTSRLTDEPAQVRTVNTKTVNQPTTESTSRAAVLTAPTPVVGGLVGCSLEIKSEAAAVHENTTLRKELIAHGISGKPLEELSRSGLEAADVTNTARDISRSPRVQNVTGVLVHRLKALAATVHERNEIRREQEAKWEAATREAEAAGAAGEAAWSREDGKAWWTFLYSGPSVWTTAREEFAMLGGRHHTTERAAREDASFRRFVVDRLKNVNSKGRHEPPQATPPLTPPTGTAHAADASHGL